MEYKWNREQVEELILNVQENTCLYNIRSKEYMDRTKKAMAFKRIFENLKEEMPSVTVEDVKKKWKSLRSQYIRELRLIKYSKKSGSGITDVYCPKLWCFDQMSFLESHTAVRESQDNTDITQKENVEPSTSSSYLSVTEEECEAKRQKKSVKAAELCREFGRYREHVERRKSERKFSWVGSMMTSQLEAIHDDYVQDAIFKVQEILQMYIKMSMNRRNNNQSSSPPSSPKDLLQMSMEGLFDDDDLENL